MQRKICCFCEGWESGGIESFLNNVLQHMDLSGLDVEVVVAELRESVFTERLASRGIRLVQLSGNQKNLPKNYRLFRKLIKNRKYDVIHFNLFQGLALRYVHIAKQEGVPVRIVHSHNTALRKSKTLWLKMMLHKLGVRRYTKDATALWACSGAAAEFLFDEAVRKQTGFQFIPNGIETDRFRFCEETREAVRAELGISDSFVVGNIGRLCYQKNQSFLLDVFAALKKERPDSVLLLVGEGDQRSTLEQEAKQLGIADAVIFYGTSEHIEQLLWAMDVFVFPSHFEGLGIAAVEAQSAGLPVVCSDRVPPEARIIDKVRAVQLSNVTDEWVRCLRDIPWNVCRGDGVKLLNEAGFDIDGVSAQIRDNYVRVQE